MKEIYVDKMPKKCPDCMISVQGRCWITHKDTPARKRRDDCPLKELSNSQKIVQNFEEDDNAIFETNWCIDKLTIHSPIEDLIEYSNSWSLVVKEDFWFTDWKGAREALRKRKKVTYNSNDLECSLHFDGSNYKVIYKDGSGGYLEDHHYDTNEWMVWD